MEPTAAAALAPRTTRTLDGQPGVAPRVLLVSPVRNEARHIRRVAAALAAQTRQPDAWIVADDSSTDDTLAVLLELERETPFLRVTQAPSWPDAAGAADRLALAAEARTFNWALAQASPDEYDFVGKLDGDIELPPDYLERLLERFQADPGLGVAGGSIVEPAGGGWRRVRIPDYHVHGALKLYRSQCLEAVGGIQERLGWDTIDETYARMRGYRTRSFQELVTRHHRPSATADGVLRGRARHGTCAYIVRYSLPWVALRSLKVATSRPLGLSGAAFLWGYVAAALRRTPRIEDEEFTRFTRRELRRRLMGPAGRLISG